MNFPTIPLRPSRPTASDLTLRRLGQGLYCVLQRICCELHESSEDAMVVLSDSDYICHLLLLAECIHTHESHVTSLGKWSLAHWHCSRRCGTSILNSNDSCAPAADDRGQERKWTPREWVVIQEPVLRKVDRALWVNTAYCPWKGHTISDMLQI